MIKTAVIGASGYIGRHLLAAYRAEFPDCVGTAFSRAGYGLTFFDVREPKLDALQLEETGHRCVLIASAKPNIAYCEKEKEAARALNVRGTLELVRQAGRRGIPVIFLSSDYVFDGSPGPHDDDAPTRPSTEYGRQKVQVEKELPGLAARHVVLRLSKIFGTQKGDGTLLDEMACALSEGRVVQAAEDQLFCPTSIEDLVAAILAIQAAGVTGTLNVCAPEIWSRHRMAAELAAGLKADPGLVKKIKLHDLPAMVGRPLDTSMKCSRLARETRVSFGSYRAAIDRVVANWRRS